MFSLNEESTLYYYFNCSYCNNQWGLLEWSLSDNRHLNSLFGVTKEGIYGNYSSLCAMAQPRRCELLWLWSEEVLLLWLPGGWMRRVTNWLCPLLCPWALHGKLGNLALAVQQDECNQGDFKVRSFSFPVGWAGPAALIFPMCECLDAALMRFLCRGSRFSVKLHLTRGSVAAHALANFSPWVLFKPASPFC